MIQKLQKDQRLVWQVADIQYLPHHRCPKCGALPMTTKDGQWFKPFQDWFHTALSNWLDHLGYVSFQCDCVHHPEFRYGSLRVARLGDAILPIEFDDGTLVRQAGLEPAWINANRVSQAVAFLAQHADPERTSGSDFLAYTLYAVSAGMIGPDLAARQVREWLQAEVARLAVGSLELPVPAGVKLLERVDF